MPVFEEEKKDTSVAFFLSKTVVDKPQVVNTRQFLSKAIGFLSQSSAIEYIAPGEKKKTKQSKK